MMTPTQFTAWRLAMGFTRGETARRLTRGKNTPKEYEEGTRKIPPDVDLLCSAIALGVRPYSESHPDNEGNPS